MHRAAVVAFASLEGVNAIEPDAQRLFAVGVKIGQRSGDAARVPLFAIDCTGMTTDADIKINHEPEVLARRLLRQTCHYGVSRERKPAPYRNTSGRSASGGRLSGGKAGSL